MTATIDPETWARSGATLRLGEAPMQIDVLIPSQFIGLEDLLANKRGAARPKDLADVAALEQGRSQA